ncbi:MAG: hypothetical protein N3F09_07340 [Bacteroidia bacterium]|nr:hypothetical protein [Bacteroidia bacterium]
MFIILIGACQIYNKKDHRGYRHGKWRFYYDNQNKCLQSCGKFNHGNPVGRWKYYTSDGILYMKEKYLKNKRIYIQLFDSAGRKVKSGFARIDEKDSRMHYYWYGKWKIYDERGKIFKYIIYDQGLPQDSILN